MSSRRRFIVGAAVAVATPYIVRRSAIAATPLVRRDVMSMPDNDPFFADYATAVKKMHEISGGRSWLAQAKIHADHCKHGELEFLHWHRHYLRFFEKICASLCGNPNFALPYWNWSKNSGRYPAPFFDLPELNVVHWNDPGQYNGAAWGGINTAPRRGLDKTQGLLDDPNRGGAFTLNTINGIKGLPTIDLFQPALEGQPHNSGHVVAGAAKAGQKTGHIGSGLSPLDPIFWLHHCMVDRVWAEWQKDPSHVTPDPKTNYAGNFVEADGSPASANSTGTLNIADLGYTYDVLQGPPLVASANTQLQEFNKLFPPAPRQTLGTATNDGTSRVNIPTAITVTASALPGKAAELHALAVGGVTLPRNRILAKLSDISWPETADVLVNVFVDCPYLSPETPYSDPHYAGSFSFFGSAKAMPGMPGMSSAAFVIDITRPVREQGLSTDKIKIQLMPVPAAAGGESSASFKIGKVEILSV